VDIEAVEWTHRYIYTGLTLMAPKVNNSKTLNSWIENAAYGIHLKPTLLALYTNEATNCNLHAKYSMCLKVFTLNTYTHLVHTNIMKYSPCRMIAAYPDPKDFEPGSLQEVIHMQHTNCVSKNEIIVMAFHQTFVISLMIMVIHRRPWAPRERQRYRLYHFKSVNTICTTDCPLAGCRC
jgi:hypothetical protein